MECADKLIDYIGRRYSCSYLIHSPDFTDIRPFTWAGWTGIVRYTYLIDLTDPEKIWDLMERRVRTVLRKAESTLVLGKSIELEQFGRLYDRIYTDREKIPPIARSTVISFVDKMVKSGLAEIRTVLDNTGEVISAMALVSDEKTAYAWISGSIPGRNSSGAFSLLFWDAIRRYSATCLQLDMVGANIPSIAFFKKGFGGLLKPYYVTEWYSSMLSRVAFGVYAGMKRFFPR